MELAAKLDDYGKPAWIAVMILGFVIFWPVGLAILAYLIWSGRMGCWRHGGPSRWHEESRDHRRSGADSWFGGRGRKASSGNHAFDEYREETLRRLEDEQKEFVDFLERLRHAKDKAEFDQFMADRKRPPSGPDTPDAPEAPEGATPQP
jgi:hypothetical protein